MVKEYILIVLASFGSGHSNTDISIDPTDLGYPKIYSADEYEDCKTNTKLINVQREVVSVDTNHVWNEEYLTKREIFKSYCVEIRMPE